jgi:hypothetical protein
MFALGLLCAEVSGCGENKVSEIGDAGSGATGGRTPASSTGGHSGTGGAAGASTGGHGGSATGGAGAGGAAVGGRGGTSTGGAGGTAGGGRGGASPGGAGGGGRGGVGGTSTGGTAGAPIGGQSGAGGIAGGAGIGGGGATSIGGRGGGGGGEGGIGGSAAVITPCSGLPLVMTCGEYCGSLRLACTGELSQFPGADQAAQNTACATACSTWNCGDPIATSGDSLSCRRNQARIALTTFQSGMTTPLPEQCAAAGPSSPICR